MISRVGWLKPLFYVFLFQMFLNTKGMFLSKKHTVFNTKTSIRYSKLVVSCFRMLTFVSFITFCTKFLYKSSNKKLKSSFSKTVCRAKKTNSTNSETPEPNNDKKPKEKDKSHVSSNSNFERLDVTQLNYPGVYEILDIKNNKSYYGQSSSLVRRLMQNHQGLMNETHECETLRTAFKEQGKPIDKFRFIIHKSGPEWLDDNLRLKYESELVAQNKQRCYNTDGVSTETTQPPEQIRKPLMYNGTFYTSSREAAIALGIGRTTVKRHLSSPDYPDVYYVEKHSFGEIPVFAQQGNGFSVLFNSMKDCVAENYASSTQMVRRRIKSERKGWRYAHLDQNKKPLRIPYKLKSNEITYQQYCEICSFVYSVNFILKNSK